MTPQDELEALIARVAMGDRKAFRSLYARTSAKLFGVALRVSRERAVAEEVLQEVFLKVWDHAGRYRSNGYSPMTWLITITRNAAIDRLRRARAAGEQSEIAETDSLFDLGPGPEAAAMASDEARVLNACLAELPAARAAMVRAAYLDGLTYADIARVSGTKMNTVRTWLRRSLLQLRECLSR
jgi:RNA polymerase sigma-70 factor (ECF subfamily)